MSQNVNLRYWFEVITFERESYIVTTTPPYFNLQFMLLLFRVMSHYTQWMITKWHACMYAKWHTCMPSGDHEHSHVCYIRGKHA